MSSSSSDAAVPAGAAAPPSTPAPETAAADLAAPEALREDQITNAVAFLSHPKVRGSAVSAKRSFLEKKGLTAAEIDEAFRRVPEAPPAAPAAAPAAAAPPAPSTSSTPSYGTNNLVTYTQQAPPGSAPPHALVPHQGQPVGALVPAGQQHMQPVPQPVTWSQVVLGLGVAAISLYGLHQLLAPRLTAWGHQLFAARREAREAEAARSAALTAALERLADGQAKLQATVEDLAAALEQQQQQAGGGGGRDFLSCQSPLAGAQRGEQQQNQQQYAFDYGGHPSAVSSSRAATARGGDSSSWDGAADRRAAAGSGSQPAGGGGGGYRPAGSPANGFEVVPRSPAWGGSGDAGGSAARGYGGPPADASSGGGGAYAAPGSSGSRPGTGDGSRPQQASRPDDAPRSAAFHEVMEMVRQGITPPNVRSDINDSPPDPSRPISAAQLQPRGKPWERSSNSSSTAAPPAYGAASPGVGDNFGQQQAQQQGANGYAFGQQQQQQQVAAGLAGRAAGVMDSLEAAATSAKAASYDLSRLLGSQAGASSTAPWRPPPPPAPTVARPGSSGSSSGKPVPPPAVQPAAADGSGGADVVAGVAASAVRNVVEAAQVAEAAQAAAA